MHSFSHLFFSLWQLLKNNSARKTEHNSENHHIITGEGNTSSKTETIQTKTNWSGKQYQNHRGNIFAPSILLSILFYSSSDLLTVLFHYVLFASWHFSVSVPISFLFLNLTKFFLLQGLVTEFNKRVQDLQDGLEILKSNTLNSSIHTLQNRVRTVQ